MRRGLAIALLAAACGPQPRGHDDVSGDDENRKDAAVDSAMVDAATGDGNGGGGDSGGGGGDGGGGGGDGGGGGGIINGGPCMSGQAGATAYRVRWAQSGSTAYVVYEVNGLPDHSRDHTGAFGFNIGFTPQYVDPFLAQGGVQLDSSDFIDIELTTAGVSSIANAKLALYGRSYNTTTSGSFNWQTFDGTGSTPTNFVSNAAPYQWYAGDMTTEISPGDTGVLIRIKAGPNSGALVVNRIELCMTAN